MSDLDLDGTEDRYFAWHGADNDTPGGAQFWPDGDPDESMSHYIVRNDVPALVAEVRRLRALEDGLTEEVSKRREPCGCRRPLDAFGSCCFNGYTGEVAERRFVTPWKPTRASG